MKETGGGRDVEDMMELFSRCSRRVVDLQSKLPDDAYGTLIHRQVERVRLNLQEGSVGLSAAINHDTPCDESQQAMLLQSTTMSAVWACQGAGWGLLEDVENSVLGGETWFVHDTESPACLPPAAERRFADACEMATTTSLLLLEKLGGGGSALKAQHAAATQELARLKRQLAAVQLISNNS